MVPVFKPEQVQSHGPLPVTAEFVPLAQRFVDGAVVKLFPFAVPQAPFTLSVAEHGAAVPSFKPAQLQSHGPVPVTVEAVPLAQRFDAGALVKLFVFDEPQTPSTSSLAEQRAVAPPFDPAQVQFQGPAPVTVDGVPEVQKFDVGFV